MSWIDKLDNSVFTITTGDGKVFTPLLKITETSKEFNASVYEFINKEGSLIDRKKAKGRKFPLLFYFIGADNIEQADLFDKSANDSRVWKIKHPFYGNITGQPLSLTRNDSNFNSTEVNVDFWESISASLPTQSISLPDAISKKAIEFKNISAVDYTNKVAIKPADVNIVKGIGEKINNKINGYLDKISYSEYKAAANDMFTKIDGLIAQPGEAMKAFNEVIEQPSKFLISVSIRANLINSIYDTIKAVLVKPTSNNKAFFEANGGAAILSLTNALVNPLMVDYVTRNDIALATANLTAMYNDYLATLDAAYVPINNVAAQFSASNATQLVIKDTVLQTMANLSGLAFNAKQERITVLEKDSNLILLTHKYMGLDANDENLEAFRQINNITNKTLLNIKKGRKIIYYV